jgi:PTS system mannose-specific IID component
VTATVPALTQRPTLSRRTRLRVFWRSLFIQAGFSSEALQTLGLLYALEPALRELYPDEAVRKEAVRRHLVPFNTHPYVAAGLVGGILFHETRIARHEEAPDAVTRFKQSLMGPLAAVGDGFFWLSLRPAAGALAALLAPFVHAWAALIFVVLYNVIHLWLRARLFLLGWRHGDGLVAKVAAVKLPMWGNRLRTLAAACSGAVGSWLALRFGSEAAGLTVYLSAGALSIGVVTLVLAERGVKPMALMYLLACAAITAGFFA